MDKASVNQGKNKLENQSFKRISIKRNNQFPAQCYLLDNRRSQGISQSIKTSRLATSMPTLNNQYNSNQGRSINVQAEYKAMYDAPLHQKEIQSIERINNMLPKSQSKLRPENAHLLQDAICEKDLLASSSFPCAVKSDSGKGSNINQRFGFKNAPAPAVRTFRNSNMQGQRTTEGQINKLEQNCDSADQTKKCNILNDPDYTGPKRIVNLHQTRQTTAKTNYSSAEPNKYKDKDGKTDVGKAKLNINKFASCATLFPSQHTNFVSSRSGWLLKRTPNSANTCAAKEKIKNNEIKSRTPSPKLAFSVPKEVVKTIGQKSSLHNTKEVPLLGRKCPPSNKSCLPDRQSCINTHSSQQRAFNLSPTNECVENKAIDMRFLDVPKKGISFSGNVTKKGKNPSIGQESRINKVSKNSQPDVPIHSQENKFADQISKLLIKAQLDKDINVLPEKLNLKPENVKRVSLLKENQSPVTRTDYRSRRPLHYQNETASTIGPSTSSKDASNEVQSRIVKGERSDRGSEKQHSESSNSGFKCDSFLKEILKEVAEKISKPSFQNDLAQASVRQKQLLKTSNDSASESQSGKSKKQLSMKLSIPTAKTGNNECPIVNHGSKIVAPFPNEISVQTSMLVNSYEYEKLKYASNSSATADHDKALNKESSPEHSTVSLEVKSVNLSFSCADKHIQNSSRQIRIKWCISPSTNAKWKTESVVVEDASDLPEKTNDSCKESTMKVSPQTSKKKSRVKTSRKCEEQNKDEKLQNNNVVVGKSDQCEPTLTANLLTSPKQTISSRLKHLSTRPSDTTLRSPSPWQTTKCSNIQKGMPENLLASKGAVIKNELEYSSPTVLRQSIAVKKEKFGPASSGFGDCWNELLQRKHNPASTATKASNDTNAIDNARYKHKCAAKILARNPENNLVPRTVDRYLMLRLDWGVFIVVVTAIPVLLLLLSMNFYLRAASVTENIFGSKS